MWFKNIFIYRLPKDCAITAEMLKEKLETNVLNFSTSSRKNQPRCLIRQMKCSNSISH